MQSTPNEDPLKKREQFAVSLRREKTKQIISAKRRRLLQAKSLVQSNTMQSHQPVEPNEVKMNDNNSLMALERENCFNLAHAEYCGYYKFTDSAFFE